MKDIKMKPQLTFHEIRMAFRILKGVKIEDQKFRDSWEEFSQILNDVHDKDSPHTSFNGD